MSLSPLELAAGPGQTGGMMRRSADTIAVLRIEIEGIEPLIWRRVAMRTATNLPMLHKVIQVTMGWLDYHLWEFHGRGVQICHPRSGRCREGSPRRKWRDDKT